MSGGSTQSQTTTTTPWVGAEPYLHQILGAAAGQFNQGSYVGMTGDQQNALNGLKDFYANGMNGLTDQVYGGFSSAMKDPTEVATSQQVQDMIAANTAAVNTALAEEVMPGIRSGAAAAGQYGGSRQGVAEGVAAGKAASEANRYATELTGNIYQQQYQNNLNALSQVGNVVNTVTKPYTGVYDVDQLFREDAMGEENYMWDKLNKWARILYPTAGMGGTSVTTGNTSGNSLSTIGGIAGTALGGYGMGNAFGWW